VIVTGASGALGREVCSVLATKGMQVVEIHGTDLSDPSQASKAIDGCAAGGPIDGLVNIAGGFAWETVAEGDVETWDRMWAMNLKTALNASRAALAHMTDGGSIVNIGAAATAKATAGMGAYTASKSAVARLTEALADELRPRKIRVNAVLPTIIDTPSNREDMPDADFGAWVTTGQLARIIAFLLSDESSAVSGASIPTL
jgi:NAD(P)-dependent dehydrogenase (short-subunit alcohol dehydrogenase family)